MLRYGALIAVAFATFPANAQQMSAVETPLPSYRQAKSQVLQEFNQAYLSQLLRRTNGNITKAAQLAGKERRAFGKLLKRYRIAHGSDSGVGS
jgi:DNA-binding NtrC family response regulator